MEILSTRDYDMFHLVKSNREIDLLHVKKIKESILQKNLLKENPIIVSSAMEIIEGQHRWMVAKELDIDLFYMISDEVAREDISRLNTNKMNWKIGDYLNFWFCEGKDEYKKISAFKNAHPFLPLSGVLQILGADYKGMLKDFKEGTFQVKSVEDAETLVTQLEELREYGKFIYSLTFLRTFNKIVRNDKFDFKKLIYQIKKQPLSFVPCINDKQYNEMFESIFNRSIPAEFRTSFR